MAHQAPVGEGRKGWNPTLGSIQGETLLGDQTTGKILGFYRGYGEILIPNPNF